MKEVAPSIPKIFEPADASAVERILECVEQTRTKRFTVLYARSYKSTLQTDGRSLVIESNDRNALYERLASIVPQPVGDGRQRAIVVDRRLRRGWKTDFRSGIAFVVGANKQPQRVH